MCKEGRGASTRIEGAGSVMRPGREAGPVCGGGWGRREGGEVSQKAMKKKQGARASKQIESKPTSHRRSKSRESSLSLCFACRRGVRLRGFAGQRFFAGSQLLILRPLVLKYHSSLPQEEQSRKRARASALLAPNNLASTKTTRRVSAWYSHSY